MKIIIVMVCLLFFMACKEMLLDDSEVKKQELLDLDMAMSNLAFKKGFHTSLLLYADTNFVKLSEGHHPIIGKQAFASSFDKDRDLHTLSWSPIDAEVAQAADLGFTWGNWELLTKDSIYYGNYFTLWKKQKDGHWKILFDGGNNTPKPE